MKVSFQVSLVSIIIISTLGSAWAESGLPDAALTPGVTRALTLQQICATKWGKDARAVTEAMKEQVFAAYQIAPAAQHLPNGKSAYEIDHLISRELGGADDVKNLWPQPYTGSWNAHLKDRVENRLHVEVCAGRLALDAAQREIAVDWRVSYRRYFGEPPS